MSAGTLARLGWAGVAAGVLGLLSAAFMIAWPPQVPAGVLSYPFTASGFRLIQSWFFAHHLLMDAVALGFAYSAGIGASRLARSGAVVALSGLIGLTAMELFARQFADWDTRAANEGILGTGYGVVTSLTGLGMLVAGVGVIRARQWPGLWRFVPLLIGVTQFAVVTPAVFSGGFIAARLAIGSWMVLFGALGFALVREAAVAQAGAVARPYPASP